METFSNRETPFLKTGCYINGTYQTLSVKPCYKGAFKTLGDVLQPLKTVPSEFLIQKEDLSKWEMVKSAKEKRGVSKTTGKPYLFREGKVAFPDALDKPSRTIITREGGSYISREKHTVLQNGKHRRLTPVELERLSGFPDGFTQCNGVTNTQRAFFIGNALVVGVVEKIGKTLFNEIQDSSKK